MAQIINEYRGLGNALGAGLGAGFSSSLQELAKHKLEALKSQAGAKAGIKTLTDLDIDPVSARFIYDQPAKQRAGLVADYFREKQAQQQPPEGAMSALMGQAEQQEQQPQQPQGLASLFNQGTTGSGINPQFLQQLMQQSQPPAPQQMTQAPQPEQAPQEQPQAPSRPEDILKNALSKSGGSNKSAAQERILENQQKALEPFITKEQEDYKVNRQIVHKAQEALELLQRNYKKWPGAFTGNLSEAQRSLFLRDEDVREYAAKIAELVILKGQSRKGLPSNFKLKLEQLAKADLNQPVKTQERILESMIDDASESERKWQFIISQKNPDGTYPRDLKSRAVEFDMAVDNPLAHPEFYEEGTVVEDRGQTRVLKNGKWVKA
jgi:hypothetical protein